MCVKVRPAPFSYVNREITSHICALATSSPFGMGRNDNAVTLGSVLSREPIGQSQELAILRSPLRLILV